MNIKLEYLKETLSFFFEQSQKDFKEGVFDKASNPINLSFEIYELQKHIQDLQAKYNVNVNLDPLISGKSIGQSFKATRYFEMFRAIDLELPFLEVIAQNVVPTQNEKDFVSDNHYSSENLLWYKGKFIEMYKDQLSWLDLVINKNGGTRIKVNLSFALEGLRKNGLVLSRDLKVDKTEFRSVRPTLKGLFFLLFFRLELSASAENPELLNAKGYPYLHKLFQDPKVLFQFIQSLVARAGGMKDLQVYCRKILEHIQFFYEVGDVFKFKFRGNPELLSGYYSALDSLLFSVENPDLKKSLWVQMKAVHNEIVNPELPL